MKTTTLPSKQLRSCVAYRLPLMLIPLVLAWFGLSPQARAVCQDACLTNNNTAQGDDALISNTGAADNTAIGFNALYSNTTGFENTAIGSGALFSNTTGADNAAMGKGALANNTTGGGNTASGVGALVFNTTGFYNVATGDEALFLNSIGNGNTADGTGALQLNRGGDNNTAIGFQALLSNRSGNSNIAVGANSGVNILTGSDNIDIGNVGNLGDSRAIRIGKVGTQAKTFIAGINGAIVPTGVTVIVDASGHLGTITSSARLKDDVKPMDTTSEAILALKPVTFRYRHDLDPDAIPQFGLVAEDVEKINPDLVARDEQGKPYTVRYEAVNAMLLNEFLKEHKKVEHLQATVSQQEKDFHAALAKLKQDVTSQVNEQAAQIQKGERTA